MDVSINEKVCCYLAVEMALLLLLLFKVACRDEKYIVDFSGPLNFFRHTIVK